MNSKYLELLQFIHDNPELVITEPTEYANQLTFAFSKDFYPSELNPVLFPTMRLHVERLTPDFVEENKDLLHTLNEMLGKQPGTGFNEVWITTSNVADRNLLLVQLSFE